MGSAVITSGQTAKALTTQGTANATVTGGAVDIREYIGNLLIVQQVGTVGGSSPTLDGKIQDSPDGSTGWADVTGATFTQVTASTNIQVISVPTRACKRYIRYVGTKTGTSLDFDYSVTAIGQPNVV